MSLIARVADFALRVFEAWPASPAPWRLATRSIGGVSGGLFDAIRVRRCNGFDCGGSCATPTSAHQSIENTSTHFI